MKKSLRSKKSKKSLKKKSIKSLRSKKSKTSRYSLKYKKLIKQKINEFKEGKLRSSLSSKNTYDLYGKDHLKIIFLKNNCAKVTVNSHKFKVCN